ncbi:hypothetical protein GCM10027062_26230 [Nocardioides hungaricus]
MHAAAQAGRSSASVVVEPGAAERSFTVSLEVSPPWYVYAPGASSGLPVELSVEEPARITGIDYQVNGASETLRRAVITGVVADARPGTVFRLRTQACDGARCEAPVVARLTLADAAEPPA